MNKFVNKLQLKALFADSHGQSGPTHTQIHLQIQIQR